ncbi:hypothetical protein CEXT_17471 [Caerostris extrusa]|uniref:Uncharacterized protein n=1 Tax=Caerostris extrusa TaxID=172846 RepID=A0AAV4QWS5_CAEEX|nr:hypothetical protein CEXT_17471 [Caerostris extrusa]
MTHTPTYRPLAGVANVPLSEVVFIANRMNPSLTKTKISARLKSSLMYGYGAPFRHVHQHALHFAGPPSFRVLLCDNSIVNLDFKLRGLCNILLHHTFGLHAHFRMQK